MCSSPMARYNHHENQKSRLLPAAAEPAVKSLLPGQCSHAGWLLRLCTAFSSGEKLCPKRTARKLPSLQATTTAEQCFACPMRQKTPHVVMRESVSTGAGISKSKKILVPVFKNREKNKPIPADPVPRSLLIFIKSSPGKAVPLSVLI